MSAEGTQGNQCHGAKPEETNEFPMIGSSKRGAITKIFLSAASTILLITLATSAFAQQDNRQQTKNNWRNIAIGAAGLSAFGFIKHDPRIGFAGAAGALYSLDRYEKDRKSQSNAAKARAAIFSHGSVYRNGQRYERKTVIRNGKRYYRLVKA